MVTFLSLGFALLLKWCEITGNRIIYSLSIISILIPDQVVGIASRITFDPSMGIFASYIPSGVLINRFSAILLIILVTIIKWLPIMIVISDVRMSTLSKSICYQAKMDFSSFYKSCKYVYVPHLKPVFLLLFSINFLIGFKQHELAYELTSSGGGFNAETWSMWNYKEMFEFDKIPNASTEAFFVLLILLIPLSILSRQAKILLRKHE